MERLSIDEVIAHCKRHTGRMENHFGRMQLEETPIGNSNIMRQYWEHRQVAEWLEQLKVYKDLEEQGRLRILPCAVGTTVYNTKWWDDIKEKVKVNGKTFYRTTYKHKVSKSKFSFSDIDDFGKTVFLTREEAEEALEKMKGEEHGEVLE